MLDINNYLIIGMRIHLMREIHVSYMTSTTIYSGRGHIRNIYIYMTSTTILSPTFEMTPNYVYVFLLFVQYINRMTIKLQDLR